MPIEPLLGARGIQTMLQQLRSHHRTAGDQSFPTSAEWSGIDLKCNTRNAVEFFSNLIRSNGGTDDESTQILLESCEIAPDLAIFFKACWDEEFMTFFSLTAIAVPEGGLSELLSEQPPIADYYRFEHDQAKPGSIFSHPILHAHSQPSGAPRFPIAFDASIYPALAALDFLMVQYHYDSWFEWLLQAHGRQHFGPTPAGRLTPREIAEAHSDPTAWNDVDTTLRSDLVSELRNCSRRALVDASEGLPLLNPDQLGLNYW